MKLAALAFATLFVFGSAVALGCERHACADGYTWSAAAGICVPKSVSS